MARLSALLALAALALPALAPGSLGTGGGTITGDLVVGGTDVVVVDGSTLTVVGNVVVRDQGQLIIRAGQLVLRQDLDFQYGVRVQNQGTLRLEQGSTLGSNRFYAVAVTDQGTLSAADSILVGNNPSAGTRSRVTATLTGHVLADNTQFPKMAVQLRGASSASLTGATFDFSGELTTWDTASLDAVGGTFALDYPNGKANGQSRINVRGATLQGWAFMAADSARLTVEDSTYGFPGSLFTNYLYYDGAPHVEFHNYHLVQNANFVLRAPGGDFVFDRTNLVVPSTAEVLGLASQARSVRVLGGAMRIGADHVGFLEVGPGAAVHLSQARFFAGPFAMVGGTGSVDHLLARPGSTVDFVSQGAAVTAGQLNDECLAATILPAGTAGYAQQYYGLPVPGAGALAPMELDQTLTVRVRDALGQAVQGARVDLGDALGAPVGVFDPATFQSSPTRFTDAAGTAQYLFAPTSVLQVRATAGSGTGTAMAVMAGCQTVDVTV
jgi:lipopolysaccharide export system protein LptA